MKYNIGDRVLVFNKYMGEIKQVDHLDSIAPYSVLYNNVKKWHYEDDLFPIPEEKYDVIDTVGKCPNCGVEFHVHKLKEDISDSMDEELWEEVEFIIDMKNKAGEEMVLAKTGSEQIIWRNKLEEWKGKLNSFTIKRK